MNIPFIDTIYNYNGKEVIVWQQNLFTKVYLRTIPETSNEGGIYYTENWWKFMWNSKRIGKLIKNNKNY